MGLQVIGAGLGRTGTNSLKLALEELLGGPCYHMFEVRERPDDPDVWADAYAGRLPDWETFFSGYRATVEWRTGDGWGSICNALGVDVPNHPFPHVNTTAQTRAELGLDTR